MLVNKIIKNYKMNLVWEWFMLDIRYYYFQIQA